MEISPRTYISFFQSVLGFEHFVSYTSQFQLSSAEDRQESFGAILTVGCHTKWVCEHCLR